jgi:RNA polymerase sigma-70 factor (ECF subfamily)
MDDLTSLSLLGRVKAREAGAWERLAALYGPLVYRWARKQGLNDADANDITQDVFQTVARRIEAFRRDRPGDSFRAWLRTITRYRIADFRQRAANQPGAVGGSTAQQQLQQIAEGLDSSEDESDAEDAASEYGLLMRGALELVRHEFEAPTFRAFWRITVDGESPAAVAADMQMGVWAVYQAKSRVMRRLRRELEGLLP